MSLSTIRSSWLRRNFVKVDGSDESHVANLYLAEHPLAVAVSQRGASTFLIGISATTILLVAPPPGCVALTPISYLPTGSHRVADPASTAQWRACGCFDVGLSPAQLLGEALGVLGLDRIGTSGAHDADRRRLDACLQSNADAAAQLFARWPWLLLIKHRLLLSGLDRPFPVATVPAALAAKAYTQIRGTNFQVPSPGAQPKSMGVTGAIDWPSRWRPALANVNAHKERADLAGAAAFESEAHARRLERDLTSLTESFDAERIAHAGSREALHSAQGRVEELTHQVARIAKERDDERSEAKRLVAIAEERSAAAERRALHEIEASRAAQAAAEKRAEVANRRGDAADERARAATIQAEQAQAETAQVRDRLMTETRQLTSNLAEQTALLRSAAGELHAVRSQSETRGSDLLAARDEVDQLRAELREKDRELGLSIGRADAANELLKAFGAAEGKRRR